MNYKYKDIDKIYTNIVLDYLQKGYTIYSPSMTGHQGEVSKIVLSNSNNELICIYIDEKYSWKEGSKIIIYIGKLNHKNYEYINNDTVWLSSLENIKEFVFYEIDGFKNFYTDDIIFFNECKTKQDNRLILKNESKSKPIELKHKQALIIAYRHCKQTRGYKTVKSKDIISVIKVNNKCYRVKINNKDDLIIRY